MALGLSAIRTALADQLKANIVRATNVYPNPVGDPSLNAIIIRPTEDGDYVTYFDSMTAAGVAVVLFDLELLVLTTWPDAQKTVDDYLSAGAGFDSSIHDAIETDRTLGGVVESCVVLTAKVDDPKPDEPYRALLPVQILTRKAV